MSSLPSRIFATGDILRRSVRGERLLVQTDLAGIDTRTIPQRLAIPLSADTMYVRYAVLSVRIFELVVVDSL